MTIEKKFLKLLLLSMVFIFSCSKAKKKLKILIIETYFPPISSTAALNQITGLIDRGYEVYIYSKNKCPLHKCPLEYTHPDVAKYKKKIFYNQLPSNINQFDIILCQFGYRGTDFLKLNRGTFRGKLVTCFRGADLTREVKKNPRKYRQLFRRGDLFLPVCTYFKKKLIYLGCESYKISVLRSSIDCDKFRYKERILNPNEPIRLVSVCRLVEKKGINYAICAIATLLKKYPNIVYTIVGFGPKKRHLQQLINKFGAQKNIKLVGRASQDEVVKILDNSHIFILPSITARNGDQEGIPNSVKEAMAMGLPIISTRHAGIPELVGDGVSGFLVHERNEKELAEIIEYIITHSELWPAMGAAGRKKIEQEYDKEKINDQLDKLLRTIVRIKKVRHYKKRKPLKKRLSQIVS